MSYGIRFTDRLPAGREFMFIDARGGAQICYREDAITPRNLEDSWAAYRALLDEPPPPKEASVLPFKRRSTEDAADDEKSEPTSRSQLGW